MMMIEVGGSSDCVVTIGVEDDHVIMTDVMDVMYSFGIKNAW